MHHKMNHAHFINSINYISIESLLFFRNISVNQPYDVTLLHKSLNRAHDSLQPAPLQTNNLACRSMKSKGVKENSLASHQSRYELFPTWNRHNRDQEEQSADEIEEENELDDSCALKLPQLPQTKCEGRDFFSRHETITSFNRRNPSQTPALATRCGRRPADWHLLVASHTVGR